MRAQWFVFPFLLCTVTCAQNCEFDTVSPQVLELKCASYANRQALVTSLSDLNVPTPFVYVETWTGSGCADNPFFIFNTYIAYAGSTGNTLYTMSNGVSVITFSDQSTIVLSYTFPDLTITILTPGELIEMAILLVAFLIAGT